MGLAETSEKLSQILTTWTIINSHKSHNQDFESSLHSAHVSREAGSGEQAADSVIVVP